MSQPGKYGLNVHNVKPSLLCPQCINKINRSIIIEQKKCLKCKCHSALILQLKKKETQLRCLTSVLNSYSKISHFPLLRHISLHILHSNTVYTSSVWKWLCCSRSPKERILPAFQCFFLQHRYKTRLWSALLSNSSRWGVEGICLHKRTWLIRMPREHVYMVTKIKGFCPLKFFFFF